MERTAYVTPECEITRFDSIDVISTSIHLPEHVLGRGKSSGAPEL